MTEEERHQQLVEGFHKIKEDAIQYTRIHELTEEMNFLACRRLMKPSVEDSRRMYQIFSELYELTGNKKYLL